MHNIFKPKFKILLRVIKDGKKPYKKTSIFGTFKASQSGTQVLQPVILLFGIFFWYPKMFKFF